MLAPSPVEVSLVNKTTSSICISWSMLRGLVTTLILSIKNRTSTQELITSYQEPRSVSFLLSQYTNYCRFMSLAFQSSDRNYSLKTQSAKAVCVHRLFCFKCLASGSQYTVEVITISGDRRSKPTTMTLCTSKCSIE